MTMVKERGRRGIDARDEREKWRVKREKGVKKVVKHDDGYDNQKW